MKASQHRGRAARPALALMACAAALGASGCTQIRNHQGYIFDSALAASVQPGIDTRESVQKTMGDPSFTSQFDSGTWYYFGRATKQFSFGLPKPVSQTVMAVRFDPAGNVVGVRRTGLETVVRIAPNGDKTPTLGRRRGLFQELFGNIGAVGAAGMNAPTADNPNGGGSRP